MNATMFTCAFPGPAWLAQFGRKVPDEFFSLDRNDEDDEEPIAVVACPCGGTPQVPVDGVRGCDGCARIFVFTGRDVLVADGDGEGPSTDLIRLDHET
jgi:hypothetical protein